MNARHHMFRSICMAAILLTACIAHAASPIVSVVMPRGAQRGTEVDLIFTGDRLADARGVVFYDPGISLVKLEVVNPQQVKVRVAVNADAPLGEHKLRLHCGSGISELRTFWIGALRQLEEKEPNSDFANPQKVALNHTVAGLIDNEDVDYFVVEAVKGQRLTVEVEGMRLGATMFDPYVAILDANRFELSASDDTAMLLQDPVASVIAPADGAYIIQIRESSYGGNASSHYRAHIGTFPRPRGLFPAGGLPGKDLKLTFVGDVAGVSEKSIHLPAQATDNLRIFAETDGQTSPSANHLRVSSLPDSNEVEPNDAPASVTAAVDLPAAMNGVIATKDDRDHFRIRAKKGQTFDVNVYARRLRSPLDSVLEICDVNGNALAGNDDTTGPDSYLRWAVPNDGEYLIRVRDQLGAGGDDFVYRLEVATIAPKLTMSLPLVAPNSQDRQTIVIPKGNRFATLMRGTRADFGGDVSIDVKNLPAGVTFTADMIPANLDAVPVVFEAAADATAVVALCDVSGKPVDPNLAVPSTFVQLADLIVAGNQVAYYQAQVNQLAVCVAEPAPYKLTIVQPKVPLVQTGSMQLKVTAERAEGFKAPINLAMLFNPPGVGSGAVTIAEGATEALIPINAAGDAQVRKWKVCVVGSSDAGGPLWVSSQLADLEVAPPFVNGKLEMAAVEQGQAVQVVCALEQKVSFEGKAKVQLVGLPPNTTAVEKEITAQDSSVVFDVQATAKSPPGQHASLFCVVTVMKDNEPITLSIASGGVLRVDPPPVVAAAPAPVAAATPVVPAAPPDKPLSRLEKLRQEQAKKSGS